VSLGAAGVVAGAGTAETDPVKPPAEPVKTWDAARIAGLLAELGDEQFTKRETATRDLAGAPASVLKTVQTAAGQTEDPEVRRRLEQVAREIFVRRIARNLPEWGAGRGFLGIRWTLSEDSPGVIVQEVLANTAADKAGLQPGDVILQVNKTEFRAGMTHDEAMTVWRTMTPNQALVLKVSRAEQAEPLEIKAVTGEMPGQFRPGGQDAEAEKEEQLWAGYLAGQLKIPEALLKGGGNGGRAAPGASRKPLQSWSLDSETREGK
jgi:predicted metalloprotease with PDZ domain